jgi:hypothetical protein
VHALASADRLAHRFWDWFTDLGSGAWALGLSVLVGGALLVAVIQGRGGPEQSACHQARPYVDTVQSATSGQVLTQAQAQNVRNAATQLGALTSSAVSDDDRRAIARIARVAGGAQPGQSLDAVQAVTEFDAACPRGLGS